MEAGDQQLVRTPFVHSGYWSPCAPLIWNPVKAPDIRFSSSHFRRQHPRHEKARKRETETDNTNSVEILGESHVIFTSKNTGNNHYWSQDTSRHNTKCFFPNGTYGESRLVENIQNNNNNNNNSSGRRFLSSPQNGHSKEKLPNCTIGRTTAAEIHSSLPSLPPSLRESVSFLFELFF
ncbi:unnamed protein product [Schistosoma curassoni]|uniref:Uncharacterized protein n=1 Tax=Schistosoma curassoni TaxID=6186 RepID=A0A183KJA7_9TREM|nr:unnamed protein product [Schistosoma curassoni]